MGAGNEIWFAIRSETSEAEAGLQRVANKAAGMEGGFNGANIASNKVRQGISMLAREAGHATNAMDLLVVGLYAAEKALGKWAGAGLGATVVVAVGYQLYKYANKEREEREKINQETDKWIEKISRYKTGAAGAMEGQEKKTGEASGIVESEDYRKLIERKAAAEEEVRLAQEQLEKARITSAAALTPGTAAGGAMANEQYAKAIEREAAAGVRMLEVTKILAALDEAGAKATEKKVEVQNLILNGRKEEAKILEIEAKFDREIADALTAKQSKTAAYLGALKVITVELEKQAALYKAQDLDRANANAEAKLGLGGSDYDRKRSGLVLDKDALKEEARVIRERGGDNAEALAKKKDIEARAKDEEIDRLDMEHAKAVRAAQDSLADAEDNAPAYQRIENALQRKIEAAKREMQMLEERGELDDESAAKYKAIIAGTERDLADKKKAEEREGERLDVDMAKANIGGDKSLSSREKKKAEAKLEREYWEKEAGRSDISDNERKRAEINAKRAENSENEEDDPTKRRDPRIVSSGLGRVGLGGNNYVGGSGSLEHIAGRQLNVLEQIARNTGGGQKAMNFGRQVMTLAE